MMPGKQVFFRKAHHRQAKIESLSVDLRKIAKALHIERRYGLLLRQERESISSSLEEVAKTFGIHPNDLMSWENGLSSPPANVFYAIIQSYGKKAAYRAAKLDLEVQIERYDLILAAQSELTTHIKNESPSPISPQYHSPKRYLKLIKQNSISL